MIDFKIILNLNFISRYFSLFGLTPRTNNRKPQNKNVWKQLISFSGGYSLNIMETMVVNAKLETKNCALKKPHLMECIEGLMKCWNTVCSLRTFNNAVNNRQWIIRNKNSIIKILNDQSHTAILLTTHSIHSVCDHTKILWFEKPNGNSQLGIEAGSLHLVMKTINWRQKINRIDHWPLGHW